MDNERELLSDNDNLTIVVESLVHKFAERMSNESVSMTLKNINITHNSWSDEAKDYQDVYDVSATVSLQARVPVTKIH